MKKCEKKTANVTRFMIIKTKKNQQHTKKKLPRHKKLNKKKHNNKLKKKPCQSITQEVKKNNKMAVLFLAALAVGAVAGFFMSKNSNTTPVANNTEIVNNVTANMVVNNDTTCSASIKADQTITVDCKNEPLPIEEYCKDVPAADYSRCRDQYNDYAALFLDFSRDIKNSQACLSAIEACKCQGAAVPEACMGNCSKVSAYACFACVNEDIQQSNIATSMVTQCEQMVITAAKMKASMDASATQTNKIVADGLSAVLGNKVQGNSSKIANVIKTNFTFNNALSCTAKINTNQRIEINGGGSSLVRGISQVNSVQAGSQCMQQTNSYAESVTDTVIRTNQALDQTYKSPFSFLTDMYGFIVIAVVVVVVIIIIIIGAIFGGAVKRGKALLNTGGVEANAKYAEANAKHVQANAKYRRNLKIGGAVMGVILLAAIITIIVLATTAPTSAVKNSDTVSVEPMPNERTLLQTQPTIGEDPYVLYAAGPFLIGMQERFVKTILGADEFTTNKLAGQSVGRFLLRVDNVDQNLPLTTKVSYEGYMFQTIMQYVGTAFSYLRAYVADEVATTVIGEVIKGQPGLATYIRLTSQPGNIAKLTFDPVGDEFPGAVYISRMSKDATPKKLYLTMKVVTVDENFSAEVREIIEENREKHKNDVGITFPGSAELETFASKQNLIKYGFTDWVENPAIKTPWQVSRSRFSFI